MNQLTPDVVVALWQMAKAQQAPDDEDLALVQKYMMMHDDMHEHFEHLEQDPSWPAMVDGENLILHVAFDAATEKSLASDEPAGVAALMQRLLDAGVDPARAFHVVSQAMMHEFIVAADRGDEMDLTNFMIRVQQYSAQVLGQAT